jgi:hypothetical protein
VQGKVADKSDDPFLLFSWVQRGLSRLQSSEQLVSSDFCAGVHRERFRFFCHFFISESAAIAKTFILILGGNFEIADIAETRKRFPPEPKRLDGLKIT